MKTFLDWMLKTLAGALAVVILLAFTGTRVFPLKLPLLTAGGRKLVLNMPDAVGFIVFVCLAAGILYIIGYGIWRAVHFLWSKF
jgi:hypothetical protein